MTETMTVTDAAAMQTTTKMSASPHLTASEIDETIVETTQMTETETGIIHALNTELIEATVVTPKSATGNGDTAVIVVIHMMMTDEVLMHLQIVIEIETAGVAIHAGRFNLIFSECFFSHVIGFYCLSSLIIGMDVLLLLLLLFCTYT